MTLGLLIGLVTPAFAEPWHLEVRTSLPESVFYLLECLHHNPHESTLLVPAYRLVHPETQPGDAEGLASYERFSQAVDGQYQLPGSRSVKDVLERMAVDSADGVQFLSRSRELLSDSQQVDLALAFHHFEAPYRDSLWQTGQGRLQQQRLELMEQLEKSQTPSQLGAVARLFDSLWSPNDAFQIALVPIPASAHKGVTSYAHSLGYLQVVEVLEGEKMAHRLGVVFHELVHSLLGTMRPSTRQRLRGAFTGIEGRLAWQELNEGLATALGNGLFQERVDGAPPSHPWYNDETIDGYARELVPLLRPRLAAGQVLDENFAHQAQAAFQTAFPQADTDIRLLLRHATAATPRDSKLQDYLSTHTRMSSFTNWRGLVESACLLVCLTPERAAAELPIYGVSPPQPTRTGIYCQRASDHWSIVIIGPNEAAYQAGIDRLLAAEHLKEGWLP